MNNKILICIMLSAVGNVIKVAGACFPGVPTDVQQMALALVDERDQAVKQAEQAQSALEQHAAAATAALARADQLAHEAFQAREREKRLLDEAADREFDLQQATERAEQQARVIALLRKENSQATSRAEAFLEELRVLTETHETTMHAHSLAKKELDAIRGQKEQADTEVQRLLSQIASLSSIVEFRMQGGMSLPRVALPQFSAMNVLNFSGFQEQEQEKKRAKQVQREALQVQLQAALAGQKQKQDEVDEALALVGEKERQISSLTAQAVRLEGERIKLERFKKELQICKEADREDGAMYLDTDDQDQARAGGEEEIRLQQIALATQHNKTRLQQLLGKLQELVVAVRDQVAK